MSSNLVETVSINYEDFNESFLTCGTCLCMYDAEEHNPKLLVCSHTVCRSCLERIVEAQGRDTTSFRCPICRETIQVPRGGVVCLPPSFIVNQLLDLMAAQRRDIIPKCSVHTQQELMFCETCDTVFCMDCTGGTHNGRGASAHTVIPFSIAIKRMSEILLYKAGLCIRNLNSACDVVNEEMQKLDCNAEYCIESVSKTFQELLNTVDQRRHEVIQMIRKVRDDKKKVLKEQLDIIESEKTKVQNDCQGLQHQVEVRSITKKISDLNEKLDVTTTLSEPRENAFMKFEFKHNSALCDFMNSMNDFGRIRISKTFPALCTAKVEQPITHLKTVVRVTTVDYYGNPRTTGADPLVAELRNARGDLIPTCIKDQENGNYKISFTTFEGGKHKLCVSLFDRPVRDSPFILDVTEHNNPVQKIGCRGSGNYEFKQPVNAVLDTHNNLYVLDTGNSRIKMLDSEGKFLRHIGSHGLEHQSGTGLAITPDNTLIVVNWRTKHVTELDQEGIVLKKFTSPEFIEPISVAVNRHGEIIVADNGPGRLFVFDSAGRMINKIGSKGDKQGRFKLISSVSIGVKDEILVTDNRFQIFTRNGAFVREVHPGSNTKGLFGGATIDKSGNYLATRSEKGKCFIQVFDPEYRWHFNIDSFDDKLKRPSGLIALSGGYVAVVDLGNDCIKKYKYV